jgi:outer membrane lipoprotein-sorting protein
MAKVRLRSGGLRWIAPAALAAALCCGCGMREITAVKPAADPISLKTAAKTELVAQYNQLANSISSINASVTIQLTAGSSYSGVIQQYHEVNGFILAQKPSNIRVIGQVPFVGKNIFDMESDGKIFHIFIPSKSQFLVGPADLERPSAKPIENLRPQHLSDAIFWDSIPKADPVLLEEMTVLPSSFYVLTVVRPIRPNSEAASEARGEDWEIARKIWFDRSDLNVARIDTFDASGKPTAIVRYTNWDMFGDVRYPRQILLDRPQNDYQVHLTITKLAANEAISPDRFELLQPAGAELVRVGESPEQQTQEPKP